MGVTLSQARQENLFGWAGEKEADLAWNAIGSQFAQFQIVGTRYPRAGATRLWEAVKGALKQFTENYAQKTGDCVAFGGKNAIEYVQCVQISKGVRSQFKKVNPSYLYGTGRVLEGNGRLRGRAGSTGSWMALAVQKYGAIAIDLEGVPAYSKELSDAWGDDRAYKGKTFRDFVDAGDDHLIKTVARINNVTELAEALDNGYPVTIACNQGFEMAAGADGFHDPSGSWPHQMTFTGHDIHGKRPWVGLLNSWGDAHGKIVDFETNEAWPAGMLRIKPEVADRMIRSGEAYAYSQFDGFRGQNLDAGRLS